MRMANAITLFLSEWPSEGVSKATVRSYGNNLEWLCSFAAQRGATMVEELTPSLVRAAALAKMEQGHARTANYKGGEAAAAQLVAAARRLASWLLAEGVPVDDLAGVKAPRVPERVQSRLMPGEFEALQAAILRRLLRHGRHVPRIGIARDIAIVNVLAETGLRAQEMCGLELDHVDLRRGEILVVRAKRRRERVLPLVGTDDDDDPFRVVRLIDDWIGARAQLKHAAEHRALWLSLKGNPLTEDELRNILRRLCEDAGLPANRPPHAFRRYVFTEHYRARPSSLPRLSARMGWSPNSHKMPGIYSRGVELDFARDPMPLLNGQPKSPITESARLPILLQSARERAEVERRRPAPTVREEQGRRRLPKPVSGSASSL